MNMNIQKALIKAESFSEILNIANQSAVKISFFGDEHFSSPSFSGKLPLNSFAERVRELLIKGYDFDEAERQIGRQLSEKISFFYTESKIALKNCNCLTRLFNFIRCLWNNIFSSKYDIRSHWETDLASFYDFYTKEQYQKTFGQLPPSEFSWRGSGHPERWLSPEARQRYFGKKVLSHI